MNSSTRPEPTMEEILAAIRKIITGRQPSSPSAQAEPAVEPDQPAVTAHAELPENEVLKLTAEVRGVTPTQEPVHAAEPQAAPSEPHPNQDDIAFETTEEREPPMEPDDLISDTTHNAVGKAFAALDEIPGHPPAPTGTLDAVFTRAVQDAFAPVLQDWINSHQPEIIDQLKPMLREWMDHRLPPVIESAVAKEISRAIAARRR